MPWRLQTPHGVRYVAICQRCDRMVGWNRLVAVERHLADLAAMGFVYPGTPEAYDPGDGDSCACAVDVSQQQDA